MGLLDFLKVTKAADLTAQVDSVETKKAKKIASKIIKQQLYRFNKELREWKIGVNAWEDTDNPTTAELISVYNDIIIDAHLSAVMEARICRTTSKDFKIVDEKGEELPEETEIFQSIWFRDFIKYALESKFFGYSLIQFSDLIGKSFTEVEVFPREYVYAQKGSIRRSPWDTSDLVPYDRGVYAAWTLGIGKTKDLGLLMKAAPLVIFKKTALGSWTEFVELFGAPFRLGKTSVREDDLRNNMYDMLENMGRNAFGVFDKDDTIEFVRDNKTDSHNVFNQLIDRANTELSKLILGSTMTTDDGSSRSQSEVHERTTAALNKEDAFFITEIVNTKLIPWLNQNHDFNITGKWTFDDTENTTKEQQFKIDIELVKNGFNVPKEYFTETYGTPIDEKEELIETDPDPNKKKAKADDVENALKKKTTLTSNYDAFIAEHSCLVCNELDYEEAPPQVWEESFIEDIIRGVYVGTFTLDNLPESLYLQLADRITQGIYSGLASGTTLTSIPDPAFINSLRNNAYIFSGAKTFQQTKLMSDFLLDADGNPRSFKEYKEFARKTFGDFNEKWLRTEINHATGSSQMAGKWQQFEEEADLFPLLKYVTAGDERVRDSHRALNGIIKPVNDPFWDSHAPINGFNCRCDLKQVEEGVITPDKDINESLNRETKGKIKTIDEIDTPIYMKNNPGKVGSIFDPKHPYFIVPEEYEAALKQNFGLKEPKRVTQKQIFEFIKKARDAKA